MAVLSNREKVSIFLAILGPDISAKILRYLPEEMALLIASGVNKIVPSKEAVRLVLRDFSRLFLTAGEHVPSLEEGSEKKEMSLEDLSKKIQPKQWFSVLSKERVQTIAFIFSKFPSIPRNQILPLFPEDLRLKIEEAFGKIKKRNFSESIVIGIEEVLKNKLAEVSSHGIDKKRAT